MTDTRELRAALPDGRALLFSMLDDMDYRRQFGGPRMKVALVSDDADEGVKLIAFHCTAKDLKDLEQKIHVAASLAARAEQRQITRESKLRHLGYTLQRATVNEQTVHTVMNRGKSLGLHESKEDAMLAAEVSAGIIAAPATVEPEPVSEGHISDVHFEDDGAEDQ